MRNLVPVLIGFLLILFVSCSNESSLKPVYNVANIELGDSYKNIIERFGEPTEEGNTGNGFNTLIYRDDNTLFMVLKLNEGRVNSLDAYPIYAKEKFVSNEEEAMEKFGKPDKVETVQCYHTANCQRNIYETNKQRLEILFSWDKKDIDRIKLFYKD